MNYQLSVIPKFPARVVGGNGIRVTRANGVYTIEQTDVVSDYINVKNYGAIGDGATDDTGPIEDAIVAFKAAIGPGVEADSNGAVLFFPPGRYRITRTLNLTGIISRIWTIRADGATIEAATNGKPAIDMMGSRYGGIYGLRITGDAGLPPNYGILRGRLDWDNNAGEFYMEHVRIDGVHTRASMYILAAETCEYNKCSFWNDSTSPTSHSLIVDDSNIENITSQFITVTMTPGMANSFNENLFLQGDFRKAGGSTILYQGEQFARHQFINCYAVSPNSNIFEFYKVRIVDDMNVQVHVEIGSPPDGNLQNAFLINNDVTFTNIQFRHFQFSDFAPQFKNACIALTGGGTNKQVVFTNSQLHLGRKFSTSTAPVFQTSDPTRILFEGDIYSDWANVNDLHTEQAIIVGSFSSAEHSTTHTMGPGSYWVRRLPEVQDWYKTWHKGNLRVFGAWDSTGDLFNPPANTTYIEFAGTNGVGLHPSITGSALDGTLVPVGFLTPFHPPAYNKASMPNVATYFACLIYVLDSVGNKHLAVSDGVNWRHPDGTLVA